MECCCYIDTENFRSCNKIRSKNSFFCTKHKYRLFSSKNFYLVHSTNFLNKILKDMKIKTSNSLTNKNSLSKYKIGSKTYQMVKNREYTVFLQLFFPNRELKLDAIEGDSLKIDSKILEKVSKMGIPLHFTNTFDSGMFGKESLQWEPDFSLKENLNRIYFFIIKEKYNEEMENWIESKKEFRFTDFRKNVLKFNINEIVIFSDLPLVIQKKNYILDIYKT